MQKNPVHAVEPDTSDVMSEGISPPPMEMLGQGARLPTPEELEQEKQFNAQQIALAGQWLKSNAVHQRVVGAEQLNAYQSSAAEQLLLDALQHDLDPLVRKTAAQSLGLFKALSDDALDVLLVVLKDTDSGTRMAALDTLLSYSTRINMDAQRFPQILFKLKQKLKAGHLNKDVSLGLQAFVADQKPVTNVFFLNSIPQEKTDGAAK